MRHELRIAGFGGQGVIKAAVLVTLAAGLKEGKEIAQTQSYGPEARGGACRSDVVISGEAIDYMKPMDIDTFVVMSQPAMDKYAVDLDLQKAVIIADSTLVGQMPDKAAAVYSIEATKTAEEKFGAALYANIIMLGALAALTGTPGLEALSAVLEGNVPPKTLANNRAALEAGHAMGLELKNKN
jgi:2-oxoglutarate ferredoxin oxidoreductase subunit gamma